jgi:hypothetical protein
MRLQARKPTGDASKGVKYSSGSPSATVQSNYSIPPAPVYSERGSISADRGSCTSWYCIALDEGEIQKATVRCDCTFHALGWRSDVAIRCQESGRSFRSNAYSLLEGLSNAAYLHFLRWGKPKRECGACMPSICLLSDVAGACGFESTVSTYDVQYRYPIGQPVQQSQEPPIIPLGSMHLLTHASEVPVPRQPRSLQNTDGVDFYSGDAGCFPDSG